MAQIEDIRNLAEPIRSFNFRVMISPLRGVGSNSQSISIRCSSTTMPGVENNPTIVRLQGFEIYYPGLARYSHSWPTKFTEGVDAGVLAQISSWAKLATDAETQISSPALQIKSNATIELLDSPGNTIWTKLLIGVWPHVTPTFSLDTESPNPVEFDVDWYYDYWRDGKTSLGSPSLL